MAKKVTQIIQTLNETQCETTAELTGENDKITVSLNPACPPRLDWNSLAAESAADVDFLDLRPDVIPITQPSRR